MLFFKSIRFKIMLWYIAFLILTLSIFSLLIYGSFKKTLIDDLDDLLSSRADGISHSIEAYRQAKSDTATPSESDFIKIARNWVEEKSKDPQLMSIFTQILDLKGEPIVASKPMPSIVPLDKEDLKDVLEGDELFDTVTGKTANGRPMKFRLYTKPIMEDEKVIYVVQVAGPIGLLSLALYNLALVLFVLLPLTVILASLPSVILVRLTLKPVDRMIDTLKQITTENLKLRIHIPDTGDEIKRLADTFNDMIDRLDRSFSSQQRFIQDMSEELKVPMGALGEELDAIRERGHSPQECGVFLSNTKKILEGLSNNIDNLLFLSRFDTGPVILEIRRVDLVRLVEQALKELKPLSDDKDITVSYSHPEAIMMDADENRIRQVVLNLADNAIKYTHRKGKVAITVYKDEKQADIAVSDTGIGIPAQEVEYIFDRYYQVAKNRGTNKSFGLGLSIAKTIIDAHKGTIEVESHPGKGSTFTISLPLSYPA